MQEQEAGFLDTFQSLLACVNAVATAGFEPAPACPERDHILEEELGIDGLPFVYRPDAANEGRPASLDPETLGWAEENAKGADTGMGC
ncbi:hypothetical protein ACQPZ8_32965 [Actinomadura nitritigenes]|uniref:hypothetical protein n=1 Tax=Actinomadura nitritigenes TaxID=134602 RepID=UPI003D8B4C8F